MEHETGLQLDEMSPVELLAACEEAPIAVLFQLRVYLLEHHKRSQAERADLETYIGGRKSAGEPLGTETLADWLQADKARLSLLKLYADPFFDADAKPVFDSKYLEAAHLLWELGHFGDSQSYKIERMAAILTALMKGEIVVKYDKSSTRHYIEPASA